MSPPERQRSSCSRARLGMLALLLAIALGLGHGPALVAPLQRLAPTASPLVVWLGQQGVILICALAVYACAIWMDHLDRRAARRPGPR